MHERGRVFGVDVVDDRGQRFVVDVDELGRVLGERAARGDDERDRVADEAHLALGERRARRLRALRPDRRVPLLLDAGIQVGRREHRVHAGQRQRRRRVDRSRSRRAAYGLRTKYACSIPGNVMSSTYVPCPGEQPRVFDAIDARVARRIRCAGARADAHRDHATLERPPSTGMIAPLTNDARSETRNAATSATSCA